MLTSLTSFRDKRLFSIFVFGIASGFPWVMIGSVLSAWLKDESLSRSAIGLFGAIFAVYSINFLWAPLLDRVRPLLLGQRRGWIAQMQILIVGCCIWMSTLDAQTSLYQIALCGLFIAISSATQDIAIDAFRIDTIAQHETDTMSAASSLATAGWWTGYGGLGAIPFLIADLPGWDWQQIYLLLGGIMSLCLLVTLVVAKEPVVNREALLAQASAHYQSLAVSGNSVVNKLTRWLLVSLVEPFREFFSRNGARLALQILLFIFLFKIGEAFLGRMSIVFYKELGFSNSEIGTYSKLLNWWVTIVFSVIGGLVNIRYGIFRGLLIAGTAMAASNLMFAWMAEIGPHKGWFVVTIILDGFTSAWSTVAMVAFISLLCNRAFSATQYALMASLSVASRTLLASSSGILVDYLGGNWALFFIITAVMVIPSLYILYRLRHQITAIEKGQTLTRD
ncbi:AmpG family muropeptide MFS transporter [Alteromonas lipolytica]|uniref:MFS transporter n=1 Tax=Alteromonas lipolytica TaxID=1856405 RepID=A0A1E8FF15_9ALTE|nr:MFS transporter [Alteromonas lipolytica]OFI34500.1 MFS transporter [Alteromonas lipolytica]GGF85053.1 MFS transporter [Alteromonas lipolytica]